MSLVRPMASHPIFCLFIDLLISGDNPFTRRASRAAWVTLLMFWNPGCQKKRASKGPLKLASFISLLFACLNNRPSVQAGKTLRTACRSYLLFFEPFPVEYLEYHPWGLAILLPESILGAFPRSYQHVHRLIKVWQSGDIALIDNNSKFFKKLLGFLSRFRKFFNYALSSVFDQGMQDT